MARPKNYMIDMDGVLVHGSRPIPGAGDFIQRLIDANANFLVLTNNPARTPRDLSHRLNTIGIKIPQERIFTSAMATARFLQSQRPEGTAFVIGESGLTEPIHECGYIITDLDPDYVVLGETNHYNFELLQKAARLIDAGARFIATNPDVSGPTEDGLGVGCGATAALLEAATGKSPFFVGKPNPLMMRTALNYIGAHSQDTIMVGDRMDTDMIAGVETGLETILVLTGVTSRDMIEQFPYRPNHVLESVADIEISYVDEPRRTTSEIPAADTGA
ncbi:MAG: HAD-IIA family hydrolase [Chloroflexota bacterium]